MPKTCKTCAQVKPETDFPRDRSKPDGLYTYCKACTVAKQRAADARPPKRQDPPGMKRCCTCKAVKPQAEFHSEARMWDGLAKRCKDCTAIKHTIWRMKNLDVAAARSRKWRADNPERSRDHVLKTNYGVPIGTYDRMFAEQGGRCAICETTDTGKHSRFHMDHCHDEGHVRGLLCNTCNTGIGGLKHDVEVLKKAIEYLQKTKEPPG